MGKIRKTDPNRYKATVDESLNKEVAKGAGKTVRKVKYARVPTGAETCPFCLMLASRGAVYADEDTASHTHSKCNCSVVPVFSEEQEIEGYDKMAYYDMWKHPEKYKDSGIDVTGGGIGGNSGEEAGRGIGNPNIDFVDTSHDAYIAQHDYIASKRTLYFEDGDFENAENAINNLSDKGKQVLYDYTDDQHKFNDNYYKYLKGTEPLSKDSASLISALDENKTTRDLQAIRGQHNLPYGIEIKDKSILAKYPDINNEIVNVKSKEEAEEVAGILTDKAIGKTSGPFAFLSTSIDKGNFAQFGETKMLLDVPKGTSGVYVETISAHPGETELLLNAGKRVTVDDVYCVAYKNSKGFSVVTVFKGAVS